MIIHAKKGQTSYGEAIGILMLDTFTPFIHGDVGNAATFPFPVRYQRVEGFTVTMALKKAGSVLDSIIEAAKELEREGVKAITGDCGYMILHQ
ncbi:MAG TPA: aspartate/glutamate racemase family protein, partial [Spirochaetota bacterium]|nr:aspartate/glutamate racemase family protein [Spirochaetota bacterium]